jgi:hypothetical protein
MQAVLVVSCIVAKTDLKSLPDIAGYFPRGMRQKAAPISQALCLCSLLLSSAPLDLVFDRLLVFGLGP